MTERSQNRVQLGPSILTANLLDLGSELEAAEAAGLDFIHFDVMDGRFVPNISFGAPLLHSIRRGTNLPLDVHLMIVEPERFVEDFLDAGANVITVHAEACVHLHAVLTQIRSLGIGVGVSLNPATPICEIEEVVGMVDQVLVMSVNPGFGGQTLIPDSVSRIERIRTLLDRVNPECRLAVDGGIKPDNALSIVKAGADTLIAGSALFNETMSVADATLLFRKAIDDGR